MKTFSKFLNEISERPKQTPENNDPNPGKSGFKKLKKIINQINNFGDSNVN